MSRINFAVTDHGIISLFGTYEFCFSTQDLTLTWDSAVNEENELLHLQVGIFNGFSNALLCYAGYLTVCILYLSQCFALLCRLFKIEGKWRHFVKT